MQVVDASRPLERRRATGRGVHFDAPNASTSADSAQQLLNDMSQWAALRTEEQLKTIADTLSEIWGACRKCLADAGCSESGEMRPLGSYHYGVLTVDSEVDVLYVVPAEISMTSLPSNLRASLSALPKIEALAPVGADGCLNAPGFQFRLNDTEFKLLLSQNIELIPEPQVGAIINNTAGILAHEVCSHIMSSVPDVQQFRSLLRFVHFWAARRGVSGSHVGFFSSTAWAVCCARVCQMYPYSELSQLVSRFFRTTSRWDWKHPIMLLPAGSAADATPEDATSTLMSVLLPIGRGMPATVSVTQTTSAIMHKELRRTFKMVHQIDLARVDWADVYATSRFFHRHRHYLKIDFLAKEESLLKEWLVWGSQKLEDLVKPFENLTGDLVTLRPWPEWLPFLDAEWKHARAIFVGLHLEAPKGTESAVPESRRTFDLREPIVHFLEAASEWPEAAHFTNQFDLRIRHVRLRELEQWLDVVSKGEVASAVPQSFNL